MTPDEEHEERLKLMRFIGFVYIFALVFTTCVLVWMAVHLWRR